MSRASVHVHVSGFPSQTCCLDTDWPCAPAAASWAGCWVLGAPGPGSLVFLCRRHLFSSDHRGTGASHLGSDGQSWGSGARREPRAEVLRSSVSRPDAHPRSAEGGGGALGEGSSPGLHPHNLPLINGRGNAPAPAAGRSGRALPPAEDAVPDHRPGPCTCTWDLRAPSAVCLSSVTWPVGLCGNSWDGQRPEDVEQDSSAQSWEPASEGCWNPLSTATAGPQHWEEAWPQVRPG